VVQTGGDEVVLHTDDAVAYLTDRRRVQKHFSPAEILALERSGRIGFLLIFLRRLFAKMWYLLLFFALVLILRRVIGSASRRWPGCPASFPPGRALSSGSSC